MGQCFRIRITSSNEITLGIADSVVDIAQTVVHPLDLLYDGGAAKWHTGIVVAPGNVHTDGSRIHEFSVHSTGATNQILQKKTLEFAPLVDCE